MSSDKLDKIADDLTEIKASQKEIEKNQTEIKVVQARMEVHVEKNTEDLAEHMRRTEVLESLHKDNQIRIEKLEAPKKAWKMVGGWVLRVGSLSAAIAGVLKLIDHFNK